MTITINVPVFPMRKEIAARKQRRGLNIGTLPFQNTLATKTPEPRYSREGLEFDVSGLGKPHGSSR
ncbi:hypothetical protein [Xanthobacter agilis]|jgi:hypothetical protein|uniref:Uncharacterized protein n=1 Tax=Xanthobacter agilis TaxID=47492 RepID=A0ABU0L8S2_XANAG|nr:hypothetical protein [Xanthobacter agilis]MDQ0503544.1 hypothetical protein [Xanthobacter agilis]